VAGIGGTLFAPLATERMRRKSVRTEQLSAQRLAVYADLLRATALVVENAMTWSALPLADLKETNEDELNRLVSQTRVVASKKVYNTCKQLLGHAATFNRELSEAKSYHRRIHDSGQVDDARSLRQRMSLASIATSLRESEKRLEDAARRDMKP